MITLDRKTLDNIDNVTISSNKIVLTYKQNKLERRKPRKRRKSEPVTAWGETKTIAQWVADPRCKARRGQMIRERINAGWSAEDAISKPPRK